MDTEDDGRRSIEQILHWAFGVEFAKLDLPGPAGDVAIRANAVGIEYVLMQRAILGTTIDCSSGYRPDKTHSEAEIVADLVSRRFNPQTAIRLSELARAGLRPDWMPGETPRLEPVKWTAPNAYAGRMGATEVVRVYKETIRVPHPKNSERTITRQTTFKGEWVPCRWNPDPRALVAAREDYESWWKCLRIVRDDLRAMGGLRRWDLTETLPPRRPWEAAD